MRPLSVIPGDPAAVLLALRGALSGDGPAILVAAPKTPAVGSTPAPDSRSDGSSPAPDSPAPALAASDLPAEVPRAIALVVETSGSTARPKRVALSADALLASAAASASDLGGAGQWLLALPVHYIAGLNVLIRSIAAQTTPVILGAGSFDPLAFAAAAATMDGPLRFTSLVPAQLVRLLETDAALPALRSFDRILVGGQALPARVLARADDLGVRLTRTYGSSETGGGCVYDGFPIGNTEARIVDGQIELSGAVLADGYLGDPERTAAAFPVEHGRRWYRTGDTGEIIEGRLRVTGRLDDVIISGGIKVSLADIERVVRSIDGQADAVVVATDSPRWGEVPVVFTTRAIALDEIRSVVIPSLGPAAAPARVVVVGAIPLLSSGKPDRRAIARLAH